MKALGYFLGFLFVVGIIGVVGLIAYLDWAAYFQRFPNSAWWTYFFQGK